MVASVGINSAGFVNDDRNERAAHVSEYGGGEESCWYIGGGGDKLSCDRASGPSFGALLLRIRSPMGS
jgi:hypothetical protein